MPAGVTITDRRSPARPFSFTTSSAFALARGTWQAGIRMRSPRASTTLRAGARWAKLPFDEQWIADERITLSAGAGFLIDQTMAFDFALAHETWRGGNPVFGFDERYGATRVVVTAAYRI